MSAATLKKSTHSLSRNAQERSGQSGGESRSTTTPASRIIVRSELTGEDHYDTPPPSRRPDLREEVEMREHELTAYLSRLAREGDAVQIFVKDGPSTTARELTRLPELHRILLEKKVWGARVKHRTAGMEVVDTLMVRQDGILRVRTRA